MAIEKEVLFSYGMDLDKNRTPVRNIEMATRAKTISDASMTAMETGKEVAQGLTQAGNVAAAEGALIATLQISQQILSLINKP